MKVLTPLLILVLSLPLATRAQEAMADYQPLLENSPFLTKAFKDRLNQSKNKGSKNISFNGYTQLDGKWHLCFLQKNNPVAIWAKVGDTIEGFTIKSFNPDSHAVTIEKAGISTVITMEQPK